MEDTTLITALEGFSKHFLLFVADGHGGDFVSKFIKKHLLDTFVNNAYYQMYKDQVTEVQEEECNVNHELLEKALSGTIHELDGMLSSKKECKTCGSTLAVCLLTPSVVVCANVGDSRSILVTVDETLGSNSIVELSMDHKPFLPEEEFRILKAGGVVCTGRVDGELALSRALGDFKFKQNDSLPPHEQKVICSPDIRVYHRDKKRDFLLVLASDGLWDVFSNDSLAVFLISKIEENLSPDKLSIEVVNAAYDEGSNDNISCCIAFLFT